MVNKYWCNSDGAPLRSDAGTGTKLLSLPKYAVVDVLDEKQAMYQGLLTRFLEVEFVESQRAATRGYVYAGYLEPFHDAFRRNVVSIANGTPSPHDAEQYLVWRGRVQYNLCGYFCVAYCTGWEADIEMMLDLMQEKKPTLMARLFSSSNRGLTGLGDLEALLAARGLEMPALRIATLLHDRVTGRVMLTPRRLADVLDSYRVIYGVKINKRTGRLARSGILHWVALEGIVPNEFGGLVELYNPFGNKMETYEWDQLVESGGAPMGLLVQR